MEKVFKIILIFMMFYGIVVLSVGLFNSSNSFYNFFKLKKTQKILQITVKNLEEENTKILNEIQKIKISSDYAQKILKDKYHFTNTKEKILFVEEN